MPNKQPDLPDHLKFGYDRIIEERAIRERLLAEGHADDWRLFFKISRAYDEAHKNDPSYAETSAAFAAKWAKFHAEKAKHEIKPLTFTIEELRNLAEHYEGANDPVSQAVLTKILSAFPEASDDAVSTE